MGVWLSIPLNRLSKSANGKYAIVLRNEELLRDIHVQHAVRCRHETFDAHVAPTPACAATERMRAGCDYRTGANSHGTQAHICAARQDG